MTEYKLSDNVIANIAQLLQLAMITGTDISDHFRLVRLSPSALVEDKLELSEEYAKAHEERLEKLMQEAQALAKAQEQAENKGPGFFNK